MRLQFPRSRLRTYRSSFIASAVILSVGCAALRFLHTNGLTFSATSLAFPSTYVGAASASQFVTITNASSAPIASVQVEPDEDSAPGFAELTNCPATIPAQTACNIWITFAPATPGSVSGGLRITNAVSDPQLIYITASGLASPPLKLDSTLNSQTVFMGASIVQNWPMPSHNVGIYGQTTQQMAARFATDVLGHGYTRVVILGGSNDVTQGLSLTNVTIPDIEAMAQMASAAGIQVVLSQLPPITLNGVNYDAQVQTTDQAIRQLAIFHGYLCVDYYTPMLGHPEYFTDGEHPNAAGYSVMEAALAATVTR